MADLHASTILKYYDDGLTYVEILEFLRIHHSCDISLSTLKRWFREKGIRRRPIAEIRSDQNDVRQAVQEELSGSGSGIGYRRMHRTLRSKGLLCRRDDVRKIVKELDPEGVQLRKRRRLHRRKYFANGPNFVWHIDGHDKLKPYGFSIHGCIDGFSRKIIWLEIGTTNKMPQVVAKYYLDAIMFHGGVPLQVKADDGTEHALIEPIHIYLSSLNDDQEYNPFSIITSPQNQRIESYWSILQRDRIGWWRRFLRDLVDVDMLSTSDPVVLDCVRYCFMNLIRRDLNSIKEEWNTHIISRSRNGGPSGRPNCMFHLPHLYNVKDQIKAVEQNEIDEFLPVVADIIRDFSLEFEEFAEYFLIRDGLNLPTNPTEALHLYTYLLEKIEGHS